MTDREDCAPADLDIYITTLLAKAVGTYVSRADIEGRISVIRTSGTEHEQAGSAADS